MVQTKPGMEQGGLSKAGLLSGDVAPLLCDRLLDRARVHLRLRANLLRQTLVEEIRTQIHIYESSHLWNINTLLYRRELGNQFRDMLA